MPDEYQPGPPPREAVDYLRRKGIRTGWDYREVWREEHAHAFTIANMMIVDLLGDVRDSIAAADEDGTTAEQWKAEMTATLRKRGWWGRKEDDAKAAAALRDELRRAEKRGDDPGKIAELKDDVTRAEAALDLYVSRRLDTIWRVNTGQAAQAGAWERGMRSTSHPYVIYRVGPSRNHREQHLAWDGLCLPRDAAFWSIGNPKNGWGCKCYTRFVSEAQYRRYRRDGVAAPVVGDGQPGKADLKTDEPELRPMQYRNPKTGKIHTGYEGIDVGFERNPGVGRGEQIGELYALADERLAKDTVPQGPQHVSDAAHNRIAGTLGRRVRDDLDSVDLVHGTGGTAMRDTDIVRDDAMRDLGLYSQGYKTHGGSTSPPRISLNGSDLGELRLTAVHEIGHMIDFDSLPGSGYTTSALDDAPPELIAVLEAVRATARYAELQDEVAASQPGTDWHRKVRYLAGDDEIWARVYAQWIAWKSGSERLRAELNSRLQDPFPAAHLAQWAHDDFLPVAYAMDTLAESLGWLTIT